jgi:predicted metal-dependent peptidase
VNTKQLQLKLDKARWFMLRGGDGQPEVAFYGHLAMGLKDVFDASIPTACTDGKVIRWNPDFLEKLTDEEVRGVLLHETCHPAHKHLWRLPADLNGNLAGDAVINSDIIPNIRGCKLPKGAFLRAPEWKGLAEEEIYKRLPPPKPGKGGKQGDQPGKPGADPGGCGSFEKPAQDDQPGKQDTAPPSLEEEWERRVIQAKQIADAIGRGNFPADLGRVLAKILEQPIDWRREMADFVKETIASRNDWSRSARRHAWQRVIYPRRKVDDFGLVVIARDFSGSISDEIGAEFTAHITTCLADSGCHGLVLDHDTEIHKEIRLSPGEECPAVRSCGGGTSHLCIWERIRELEEEGEKISGVVCLSDMDSCFPEDDGGHATLWLSTTTKVGPFGRTVTIK